MTDWQQYPDHIEDKRAPFQGQDLEDRYAAHHFFGNYTHGVYLEIGGLDGITYTNTNYFSRAKGWRGMLIEASPKQVCTLCGGSVILVPRIKLPSRVCLTGSGYSLLLLIIVLAVSQDDSQPQE